MITFPHQAYDYFRGKVRGSGNDQFGFQPGDTSDQYASLQGVSPQGDILIGDQFNLRIKIYDANGVLIKIIVPSVDNLSEWGINPLFVGQNIFAAFDKFYFWDVNGTLLTTDDIPPGTASGFVGGRYGDLYLEETAPDEKWFTYSSTGVLKSTSTNRSLAMGKLDDSLFFYKGKKYEGKQLHRTHITFPDIDLMMISVDGPDIVNNYWHDNSGNIYRVGARSVERYSACGKVIATLKIPKNVDIVKDMGPGVEKEYTPVSHYGEPMMDPQGNVYTSVMSEDSYSIVKWIWQKSSSDPVGSPDAPIQLEGVSDTTGSVMLKWVYSLQDPGCVTGYEVGRATTAGGPYTAVGTVSPGDIDKGYSYHDTTGKSGTTYYYAVRAVSAIGDSPYSNEVSVTVK